MLHLLPQDTLVKLEFDKVLLAVQAECYGQLAKSYVLNLKPDTDLHKIQLNLNRCAEFLETLQNDPRLPFSNYIEEINEDIRVLRIQDYVLEIDRLFDLYQLFKSMQEILDYFFVERRKEYPHLYDMIADIIIPSELINFAEKIFDEKGELKPDASPELLKIRKNIISKKKELDRKFAGIIQDFKKKKLLTENVESFRNGRRVLSVPAEHKRQIKGIIHDESSTGKTAFVEPEAIIEINNELFDLESEERREIYRILKQMSDHFRYELELVQRVHEAMISLDVVQAKAKFALRINGQKPRISETPVYKLVRARHPLLYLKNLELGKKTVPFDFTLHNQNRIVLLSGPNAGGKSITLKTLGLVQLMIQSGILAPVDSSSELGIIHSLFVDIGDQQSIENELSTYSSRLQNMSSFLEHADSNTLILIDEFGSGTDPKIGGAIAEAILNSFNKKAIWGLITTHYSNLKVFAYKNKGIVNALMEFNQETLQPTYEFRIGKPGSSFAFEIASSSGLPKEVLKYARHKSGKNTRQIEELLVSLQNEKRELEERLLSVYDKEQDLDSLIKNYRDLKQQLDVKRKRLKIEKKEHELKTAADTDRELEKKLREIRKFKKEEELKSLAKEAKSKRKELAEEISTMEEEVYEAEKKEHGEITVGSSVRLRKGDSIGIVQSISKNEAVILMGNFTLNAKLKDLIPTADQLDRKSSKTVQTTLNESVYQFESRLDIRGMRKDEAMRMVEEFVDNALLKNYSMLEIIHGKGIGVLKDTVRQKLKEYSDVTNIRHPEPEQGGEGVTLANIA